MEILRILHNLQLILGFVCLFNAMMYSPTTLSDVQTALKLQQLLPTFPLTPIHLIKNPPGGLYRDNHPNSLPEPPSPHQRLTQQPHMPPDMLLQRTLQFLQFLRQTL